MPTRCCPPRRTWRHASAANRACPPPCARWTNGLFETESPTDAALRIAACWTSDIGSHDHPDYRAEHSYFRVLRQPGVGLDHHARAFLALAVALRYEAAADASYIQAARVLLDVATVRRAETLGAALRLAFTPVRRHPGTAGRYRNRTPRRATDLRLVEGTGVFAGESVLRRVEALAAVLGLEAGVEVAA